MDRLHPSKYRDPVWDNNRKDGTGARMEAFYNAYIEAKHIKHVYTGFQYQKQSSSYINRRFLKAFRPILDVEEDFCGNSFADHSIGFEGEARWQILVYMPYLTTEQIFREFEARAKVLRYCLSEHIKISILEKASWHCGASLVEFSTGTNEPWKPGYNHLREVYFNERTTSRQAKIRVPMPPKKYGFPPIIEDLAINIVTFTGEKVFKDLD